MEKLKRILRDLDATIEVTKKIAAEEIYANINHRVFTVGEDRDGGKIGSYSPRYKEYRGLKGFKTDFVDLKFTGDLQKSISLNDEQVFFKNEYGTKIGGYNEEHFNKKIFYPGKQEQEIFIAVLNEELDKLWKS